jgi:hypothetical protein
MQRAGDLEPHAAALIVAPLLRFRQAALQLLPGALAVLPQQRGGEVPNVVIGEYSSGCTRQGS